MGRVVLVGAQYSKIVCITLIGNSVLIKQSVNENKNDCEIYMELESLFQDLVLS